MQCIAISGRVKQNPARTRYDITAPLSTCTRASKQAKHERTNHQPTDGCQNAQRFGEMQRGGSRYQEVGLLDSLLLPLQSLRCLAQGTAFSGFSILIQLLLSHSNGTP